MHENDDDFKRGIGDNGGPPLKAQRFSDKERVKQTHTILRDERLSDVQKLIAIGVIVTSDDAKTASLGTEDLATFVGGAKRETIFKATKALSEFGVLSKTVVQGRPNTYGFVPQRVVDAILEAYQAGQASPPKGDHSKGTSPPRVVSPKGTRVVPLEGGGVVPPKGTSAAQLVPLEGTSPPKGDQLTVTRDSKYNNSSLTTTSLNTKTSTNLTTHTPVTVTARETLNLDELGERLLSACNGALDNPVNCQGLASLAIPMMWLREGCDLDADVIPTLMGYGKSAHGKRIRTWSYFTRGVQLARDLRVAGMPPGDPMMTGRPRAPSKRVPRDENVSFSDYNAQVLKELERKGEI